MSDQQTFDWDKAHRKKKEGMTLAADHRMRLLEHARDIAEVIADQKGTCTADDVQRELIVQGFEPSLLGNAAGSLFPRSRWEFTGAWKSSQRVSNHAHQNRVWRLK
jgi:hypothetical protein